MQRNLLPKATELDPGKNEATEKKLFGRSIQDRNGHMDNNQER